MDKLFAALLLIATFITVLIEISYLETITQRELILFSILQFLFSISFAVLLSRISFRSEFQESQKKFAISAFRRISEIDKANQRLLNRCLHHIEAKERNPVLQLDVIHEIAKGIRETVRSSTADWADIIGDEIATVERIESLKFKSDDKFGKAVAENEPKRMQVDELIQQLPPALRISTSKKYDKEKAQDQLELSLSRENREVGHIIVDGYRDYTFDRKITEFEVGQVLHVRLDDVEDRIAALIAYDDDNNSVGVVKNKFGDETESYDEFVQILSDFLGRSKFDIELIEIEQRTGDPEDEDFVAKILN